MIIRILGEGQYDVAEPALDRLNELDARLEAAIDGGEQGTFTAALARLLEGVRDVGVAHDADTLDESDLILPPAGSTLAEVRSMLREDGLIPG